MNGRPENRSSRGKAKFARFPVFSLVAVCVVVIVVTLGMVTWTWWSADPPSATLHEPAADKGAAPGILGAPVSPSAQTEKPPVPDDQSAQTGGSLPPAVETVRSDERIDAEAAALRANPPTLLEAMMRAQTEQGKPGQMPGEGTASSAVSPFRHDQGGRQ